ncbi:hypothetical protein ACIBG7_39935 [Nonomuraea sp. NPDC050328]|uniref:hypothetical protein n=1 Tax=Nonomuraea sp. NPDC050328 TaxID=3364361 RepID=UPI00378BCB70
MTGSKLTDHGRARLVRGFLLVLLALGISGMHTMGHPGQTHGQTHGQPTQATSPSPHQQPAAISTHGRSATPSPHQQPAAPGLDPTAVCVAILASLLVLALAARRGRLRRTSFHLSRTFTRVRRAARPPPTAPRLTALSVLRL